MKWEQFAEFIVSRLFPQCCNLQLIKPAVCTSVRVQKASMVAATLRCMPSSGTKHLHNDCFACWSCFCGHRWKHLPRHIQTTRMLLNLLNLLWRDEGNILYNLNSCSLKHLKTLGVNLTSRLTLTVLFHTAFSPLMRLYWLCHLSPQHLCTEIWMYVLQLNT